MWDWGDCGPLFQRSASHLLVVKRQLAAGRWPLAKVPVTAENNYVTAARSFSAVTGTLANGE